MHRETVPAAPKQINLEVSDELSLVVMKAIEKNLNEGIDP